jgi:hypothetical protein
MVDGLSVPAWQAELVDAVGSEPGLDRSLLLVNREGCSKAPARGILAAYDVFDRLVDRGRNTLLCTVALAPAETPVVEFAPRRGPEGLWLDADVLARLREQRLDVLLDLGFNGLWGDSSAAARFGIWTIRFGEDPQNAGDLPRLWEIVDRSSFATATLEAQGPDGARRVLGRTTCSTHPYSLLRTRCVLTASAVNLTLGRLRSLRALGPGFLTRRSHEPEGHEPSRSRPPGAFHLSGLLATCGFRVVRRLCEKVVRDDFYWSVAVAPRPPESGLEAAIRDAAFRELPQPADWFHADPFIFENRGQHFVFMEAFPYATRRGVIAVSRLESSGDLSPPETVLERPYHLSYPFVFSWHGQIFMVPETRGNRTIELYRCERFPDRWVLDTVLMDGVDSADATIFEFAGRLWMFVTLATRGMSPDTELHLFHAEDVRGPWRSHPLNPVVSDVRRARPAGAIWEENGRLIRPGQDCSAGYASATSFQRITTLTTEDYAEEPFARLNASQLRWKRNAKRTHHWCMGSRFVAIDATVSRFMLARWLGPRRGAARPAGHPPPGGAIRGGDSRQAPG